MFWSRQVFHKMTQVKRVTVRAAPSRKQQRYSLMKIVGCLTLIGGFVMLLLQSDPLPGVRKAALRHRRGTENLSDGSRSSMERKRGASEKNRNRGTKSRQNRTGQVRSRHRGCEWQ
mmetsp:Transcript_23870/g.50298  ORF Transcript_23870/g.50298 Transcript_23870/m.50298 type:complete len:116 (-) Transcript_23870:2667-3014(-)